LVSGILISYLILAKACNGNFLFHAYLILVKVTIILPEKKAKFGEFGEKVGEARYYRVEFLSSLVQVLFRLVFFD